MKNYQVIRKKMTQMLEKKYQLSSIIISKIKNSMPLSKFFNFMKMKIKFMLTGKIQTALSQKNQEAYSIMMPPQMLREVFIWVMHLLLQFRIF